METNTLDLITAGLAIAIFGGGLLMMFTDLFNSFSLTYLDNSLLHIYIVFSRLRIQNCSRK